MFKDTVFERMMFTTSSESFENTSREYEIEVYVRDLDIEHIDSISLQKTAQEQWGVYIPRASKNVSDGRIRARKSIVLTRKGKWEADDPIYHITIKTKGKDDGDIESEIDGTEGIFKQMSLMSDQGMVKTRYTIPFEYEELKILAEIDVFHNDQGELVPWSKIDIEYPEGSDYSTHPIRPSDLPEVLKPKSPENVYIVAPSDPKDSDVRKKVNEIYDRYFLKTNKYL